MRILIVLALFLNMQFLKANETAIAKQINSPIMTKILNLDQMSELNKLKMGQINSYISHIGILHNSLKKESDTSKYIELINKTEIIKRLLNLKKNELIFGYQIDWKVNRQRINDTMKLLVSGGKVISAKKWKNDINDPHGIFKNRNYQARLENVPLKGDIGHIPWSDDYWANINGGVSYRWAKQTQNKIEKIGYNYLSASEVESMSLEQMKELSPTEKYDIYTGNYKGRRAFPLTKNERKRTNALKSLKGHSGFDPNFRAESWMGLCHAWAPATLMYKEPNAVVLKGKTGIEVPFGASDIKALLTLNVHHNLVPYLPPMVGNACKSDFRKTNREILRMTEPNLSARKLEKKLDQLFEEICGPVDPGAFHIVMGNKIGIKKEGIVIDVDPGPEVWNQPVYKYSSKIMSIKSIGKKPKDQLTWGTQKEAYIKTTIWYIKELQPRWNNKETDTKYAIKPLTLDYYLYLDGGNNIIGGKWLSKDRIDYVSTKYSGDFSTGYSRKVENLSHLKEIYLKSISR